MPQVRLLSGSSRLKKFRVKYDLRKYSFSVRVVNIWNSLHNWVVSANTTDTFKARLDKFWHNQDIVYDFRAQLQGTEVGVKFCMNNFNKLV